LGGRYFAIHPESTQTDDKPAALLIFIGSVGCLQRGFSLFQPCFAHLFRFARESWISMAA
jgi:hypothetical protein